MSRKRNNRGIYRCGCCGRKGHTRDTCPRHQPIRRPAGFVGSNGSYADNRKAGLCDDCGRRSRNASRCRACTARRKRWPSRQPGYRRPNQ